jgi:hypothetical protein
MNLIPQKIQILKFIGEQGIVTVADVDRHLFQSEKSETVRITMHQLGISHKPYPGIKYGIWYIEKPHLYELLKTYFPDYPKFLVRPVFYDKVPHFLGLNCIRTAFECSPDCNVERWWSEQYIRSLFPEERYSFSDSKIPDAIFWKRKKDGNLQKYYLEFERSLKSKKRYINIFRHYSKMPDITKGGVIYVCLTEIIRNKLKKIVKEEFGRGVINHLEEVFQFIDYQELITNVKEEEPCLMN